MASLVIPSRSLAAIDVASPIDWSWGPHVGCKLWWLGLPSWSGGAVARDLARRCDGMLTNMDPASDWIPTELGCHGLNITPSGSEYVRFDGIQYDVPASGPLAAAAWINVPNVSGYKCALSQWFATGNNRAFWFGVNGATPTMFVSTSGVYQAANTLTGGTISANTWHHLVFIHDPATTTEAILLDGRQVAYSASKAGARYNTSYVWWMGRDGDGGLQFTGQVADLRAWSRSLVEGQQYPSAKAVYGDSRAGWQKSLRRRLWIPATVAAGTPSTIQLPAVAITL